MKINCIRRLSHRKEKDFPVIFNIFPTIFIQKMKNNFNGKNVYYIYFGWIFWLFMIKTKSD